MESWLSGRKRFTANEVNCKRFQGFESLTLRTVNKIRSCACFFIYLVQHYTSFFKTNYDVKYLYMKKIILILIGLAIVLVLISSNKKEKRIEQNTKQEPQSEKEKLTSEDGKYSLDSEKSKLTWKGSALTKSHIGTLNFQEASIETKDSKTSGEIIVDMNSIKGDAGDGLDSHLKSEDFFAVNTFPVSKLNFEQKDDGSYLASLEIKGIENDIIFEPIISKTEKGILIEKNLVIDRTLWGIEYKSSSLTDIAKDAAINDEIEISAKIYLTK